jgi:hypothetical protein
MCAPRVTWHTSIRYSSFSHTRVNMGQHGHYIVSHRLAAEMWTTMRSNLLGKMFLSCSFYLYRFRKYMSYGFPIINFFNPGVHYETPCIYNVECINAYGNKLFWNKLVPRAILKNMMIMLVWEMMKIFFKMFATASNNFHVCNHLWFSPSR